jgi:multimeric flavodoxin WrbA
VKIVVAYESMYGNTRQIAEAVAEGLKPLGDADLVSVNAGDSSAADDADVLVVGGPTHMHGLTTSMSRKAAAEAVKEENEEHAQLEPGAADGPGLRKWLSGRKGDGRRAASFDTRIDKTPMLTGAASRGIGKRLRRGGYEVIGDPESFFVDDSEGPLAEGELERAKEWGTSLAEQLG